MKSKRPAPSTGSAALGAAMFITVFACQVFRLLLAAAGGESAQGDLPDIIALTACSLAGLCWVLIAEGRRGGGR